MCSRSAATRRLLILWSNRAAEDPDFVLRVHIDDVLDLRIVDRVARDNLFAELDADMPLELAHRISGRAVQ